jgi:hypothetical protein
MSDSRPGGLSLSQQKQQVLERLAGTLETVVDSLTPPERETLILINDQDEFAQIATHRRIWVTKKSICAERLNATRS